MGGLVHALRGRQPDGRGAVALRLRAAARNFLGKLPGSLLPSQKHDFEAFVVTVRAWKHSMWCVYPCMYTCGLAKIFARGNMWFGASISRTTTSHLLSRGVVSFRSRQMHTVSYVLFI